MINVEIKHVEKVSFNTYNNWHWGRKKKFKDSLRLLTKSATKLKLKGGYELKFTFYFKGRKLDSVNTFHYCKIIEDTIFDQDNENRRISTIALKGKENKVLLEIK